MRYSIVAICVAVSLGMTGAGAAQHRLVSFHGNGPQDEVGRAVAITRDWNGDGVPDIVLGAHVTDASSSPWNGVRVMSGKDGRELLGIRAEDFFGMKVVGVGDTDNDGRSGFLVAAPRRALFYNIVGNQQVIWKFLSIRTSGPVDGFGQAVGAAGDVDNDGSPDIMIGGAVATEASYVQVVSGRTRALLYEIKAPMGDSFGFSVAGVGDVDRDGHDDFAIGATQVVPRPNQARSKPGYVKVYSGKTGSVLFTLPGKVAGDVFGASVRPAGDVNKDGYPDIIVGAPQYYSLNGSAGTGYARVFSGKDRRILHTVMGQANGDWFGESVSGAGDLDGDGHDDFAVGAPWNATNGSVTFFSGKTAKVLRSMPGDSTGDALGMWLSHPMDVNGDGVPDLAAGAPWDDDRGRNAGSVRVFSGARLTMTADRHRLKMSNAGQQNLAIHGGTQNAGQNYWVFGSVSGTRPGVTVNGLLIPLNPDLYTTLTIAMPNAFIVGGVGRLNAAGVGSARFPIPKNLPSLAPLTVYHAAVIFGRQSQTATNPVLLRLF